MSDQDYDSITEEIIYNCQQIFENIGQDLDLEDLNELFNERIYIEIFKIMFPFLDVEIQKIEESQENTGAKLQYMIDLLSTEILCMDLSHINGQKIAEGDQKHLLNHLQIIVELSKLYKMRNEQEDDQQSQEEGQVSNQEKTKEGKSREIREVSKSRESSGLKKQHNQQEEQLQDNELLDIELDSQGNPILDPNNPQHQEIMRQIQENLGEKVEFFENNQQYNVINRNDSSGAYSVEENIQTQIGKASQQKIEKKQKVAKKDSTPAENLQDENDAIQNTYPQSKQLVHSDSQKGLNQAKKSTKKKSKTKKKQQISKQITIPSNQQQRIIQQNSFKRPQTAGSKPKKIQKEKLNQMEKIQEQDEEQQLNLNDLSPEDIEKLKEIEDMIQRGEIQQDDPMILQLIEKIQGQMSNDYNPEVEIQEKIKQLNQVDIPKIIAEQHQKVAEGLSGLKNNYLPEDEKETTDMQQKQKQGYSKFLERFLLDHRIKQNLNSKNQALTQNLAQKKFKIIQNESENLKREYVNEQKSMYYKLRDEKINYLRKIHRIIFELEKRKIIDEKSIYKENRKQRNQDTRNVLQSIENAYKDRIDILKENLNEKRNQRQVSSVAQREVISKVERELRQEKKRQIEEVRDLWRQEKERFDMMIKDDGILEQKIMELYKKY